MFQYRIALAQMRRGASEREIARSHCMGRHKLADLRALAEQRGWLDAQTPFPEDAEIAAAVGAPKLAASTVSTLEVASRAHRRLARSGCAGHHNPGGAAAQSRLPGQLLVGVPHDRGAARRAPARCHRTLELRARRGRPGRLRRRSHADASGRHAAAHLGVRDDAVLQPPPVRRVRLGPDGGDLAGLPPARLRMVRRRAAAAHHRQRQVRDHQGLHLRAGRAARLRRVRRGIRLQDRPMPAAGSAEEGDRRSRRQVRQGQLPAAAQFRDLADLNAQARSWVMLEAGVRMHGTTRTGATDAVRHWSAAAAAAAGRRAANWALGTRCRVHRDCHVAHDRVLYSVPFTLVGKTLWLRATDATVFLYQDYQLVATHPARPAAGAACERARPPAAGGAAASSRTTVRGVSSRPTQSAQRVPNSSSGCWPTASWSACARPRACCACATDIGTARLEAACARALFHASPYYRTVKTILAGGFDQQPLDAADGCSISTPRARASRAARNCCSTPTHRVTDPQGDSP